MSNPQYIGFHTTEMEPRTNPYGRRRSSPDRLQWWATRESLQRMSHDLCTDCWCGTCTEVHRIKRMYS